MRCLNKNSYILKSKYFPLLLVLLLMVSQSTFSFSQPEKSERPEKRPTLLDNMVLQIEANEAVNDLYNFKFAKAEKQFNWIKQKYDWHPLPYFLMGLSEWWKIAPNIDVYKYDDKFISYMDSTINKAELLYKEDKENPEASFFLAAAYGFKGRLYSERKAWSKATFAGKNAIKYMEICKKINNNNPELLFGDALYNYYSVWVPENYPFLKPVVAFFPSGDKALGLQQLKDVAHNAFYTRTEAQYFLMRILSIEEKDMEGAMQVSEYLATTFPDNAYFQRYYARMLYSSGRLKQSEKVSLEIIDKIDNGLPGYEATSGRYAGFFLGQIYETYRMRPEAKQFYKRALSFGEETEAYETGYYLYSLLALARIADEEGDKKAAWDYYEKIKKYSKRKHPAHDRAREYLKSKENRKAVKAQVKEQDKDKDKDKKKWFLFW
jgi:tetratricopeptide (TPR) repeat protein